MELESAQEAFVGLLGQIRPESKLKFLEWVCSEYRPVISEQQENGTSNGIIVEEDTNDLFDQIADDLQEAVPPTAMAPGEQHIFNPSSQQEGMSASNTLHVDSFLYPSEDDIDSLCKKLEISRHYCLNCGAWKTTPLNFISHSASKDQVKYIFQNLVPDLFGKTIVDVKSRLGPVLYGAYLYSRASKIIGIENDAYFCDLQNRVVSRYNMGARVQVIGSDVRLQGSTLQSADVVVLNNNFELFYSLDEQAMLWEFLIGNLKKRGTLIITIPSIQQSCKHLTFKNPISLEHWVREVSTGVDCQDEELGDIHLYCVL